MSAPDESRSEVVVESHGVGLSAWRYHADGAAGEAWTTPAGRPVVVMAHGFGCTKDSGLTPFAERFAAAGADVLLFDYRGFGTSEDAAAGVRQDVDHRRHREDYEAVVAYARRLPGVDPGRVVLWGSSYSGGHVIAVAARDPRVAAVVSQGAAMDGAAAVLEIARYAGLRQLLRLGGHALRGLVQRDHELPLVGAPGSLAAITSDDGLPGYGSVTGPTFENRMRAVGILRIPLNRPVAAARGVTAPTMLVVAARDTIAPPAAVEAVARRIRGRVEVLRLDVQHFDVYTGATFERSVTAQVAFLDSVLAR